jgi:oligo-1,6-glucosidase
MTKRWWRNSVVYQIYPRSFQDSDGDGIGDLRGIIDRIDHLAWLGVDVVWLSPVYKSPNDDNGYDISDYQDIMTEFGTLADWEELLAALHARGIRLVMDLVINHTSDEHPWFVESRRSKDSPCRDWYIWRPAKDGREPNNWESCFGGSAWQYDQVSGEYYLHLFSTKQPDLNWEKDEVRQEIYRMMRWWLDKGIDGFRMDVINFISKAPGLPDAPVTTDGPYQWGGQHFVHGPRLREFLGEMKREVLSRYDIITVGEAPMATTEHGIELTHAEDGTLNMLFQFEHMELDRVPGGLTGKWEPKPLDLADLKRVIGRWQKDLAGKGWNSLYLSNHDQPRPVSRFGDDGRYRVQSAKLLATFLHLLQGTPYVYQGEEIGMTNVRFAAIDDYRDIETLNMYREFARRRGVAPELVMAMIHAKSRDNARTPMQWDDGPNAGFTSGTPWIGTNPNYLEINVAAALADPDSVLNHYRRLITLRKELPVIVDGDYALVENTDPWVYAFTRTTPDDCLLVVLNFGGERPTFVKPAKLPGSAVSLLLTNYPQEGPIDLARLVLRPWEAQVHRLA